MPNSILSDRDPIFMSHFWQKLFKLSRTKLRMTTAYHPQGDGQTEVVHRILQQYLRSFVHHQPSQWGKFLHWAEWHYNSSYQTSVGMIPYQVMYGKPPLSLPQYITRSSTVEVVEQELNSRDHILAKLKANLFKAQNNMKTYVDRHRIPHPFRLGDLMWVKLRP